ncbi:MAG: hypothetical protein P8M11_01210 [Planctomycetota bacterium]|nr:hypothetical protein [Planctomycetota bacterium]MDG1983163.1 hypothetical protein [Planctomycetota bacterium]
MDALALTTSCAAMMDRIGSEFLASIYSEEVRRRPENIDALSELGHVYTRLGQYEDGLAVDLRLVAIAPEDPTARYNLACSQALCGRASAAVDSLRTAVVLGYDDLKFMAEDEDLLALREHPDFQQLLAELS